mgnify:FL=1
MAITGRVFSEEPDHGGPAFPHVVDMGNKVLVTRGMDLEDWFAGQALRALVGTLDKGWLSSEGRDQIARTCYDYGAALVAERKRRRASGV